jgi:alpha-glucosidase/alpha-D-xyloside xylohydrolase
MGRIDAAGALGLHRRAELPADTRRSTLLRHMKRRSFIAFVIVLALLLPSARAPAEPLKIGGVAVELVVARVTDRTVSISFSPLDDQGRAKAAPATAVFAPFASEPVVRIREVERATEQAVGRLRLTINAAPAAATLTLTLRNAGGRVVQELGIDLGDGAITFRTEAPTFGLGEGRQQFDRRGFYYDFLNGQNEFLITHGGTIPVPFLIGVDGWGLFIHNPPPPQPTARSANMAWGRFDLRGDLAAAPPARPNFNNRVEYERLLAAPAVRPVRGRFIPRQDTLGQAPITIFLMALDRPSDAMGEYVNLFGRPAMPPKWALGYMQSHRSLAGAKEVLELAQRFRDSRFPCDALVYLGSGYTNDRQGMSGWNLGHGSLEFNPRTFEKPQEMLDRLHALNYKVVLHKNAAPATLHGVSVNDPPDGDTHIAAYWATHVPLMKMGVDAWWPDDGDELGIESRLARIRAYYEGPLKDRPGERPWALHRNGYAGAARFGAWNWSGDVTSRWQTLAAHVPVGVQFSLSVSPWWGTDIGGFVASEEYSGELYARWFQFGAFCPLFRSHGRNWHLHTPFGWNSGEVGPIESRPPPAESELHNAAVEPACRVAAELRYRLLPYNYTIAREAHDTGMPMMRALLLAYPDDPTAVSLGDEYLWGPSLLVAPVVEKGAKSRHIYLPPGGWSDFWTNEKLAGGRWIDKAVDLETIPLYVKAGTILPLDPVRQYTGEATAEPTTLRVYPGADGALVLYDDDGHSQAYLGEGDPGAQWIRLAWEEGAGKVVIEKDGRMKGWAEDGRRRFSVEVVGGREARKVEFIGKRIELTVSKP